MLPPSSLTELMYPIAYHSCGSPSEKTSAMYRQKSRHEGIAPYKLVLIIVLLSIAGTIYYIQTHFDLKHPLHSDSSASSRSRSRRHVRADDPLQDLLGDLEGDGDDGGILADSSGDDDDATFMKNELEPSNSIQNAAKKSIGGGGSTGNGDVLRFKHANGISAYLGTVEFRRDKSLPTVDGLPHFSGTASFGNGQQVLLHMTSPKGDPYWYITLKDLMKKDTSGRNITPIIAFTHCDDNSVYPWLPMARCLWTVHEGPSRGWQKKDNLKMYQQ